MHTHMHTHTHTHTHTHAHTHTIIIEIIPVVCWYSLMEVHLVVDLENLDTFKLCCVYPHMLSDLVSCCYSNCLPLVWETQVLIDPHYSST